MHRAIELHHKPRTKKPIALDVYGTVCLFLCEYLEGVREQRRLNPTEERYALVWGEEIKQRRLAKRTSEI